MSDTPLITNDNIEDQVRHWLENVVIGLNLCPFASKHYQAQQVRFAITHCRNEACLLTELESELALLVSKSAEEIETTLLIIPDMLQSFDDYNQCLDLVDAVLEQNGWEGTFQIATFHPDYQFGGTLPEDDENLTNRAPFPILHLLREESLERVLKNYPNPELIPEHNIDTVCNLSLEQKIALFPHLFSK